jgi:hypothetical protein
MAKNAGAGRGYLNPQRTDESDEEYVTPAKHYDMRKAQIEAKEAAQNEKAYTAASKNMKSGGSASSRADGIAQRGKTKGTLVMCGGGMYKK